MAEYILTKGTVSVVRTDLKGIEEAEARGYVLQGERPNIGYNDTVDPIANHPKIKGRK